MAETITVRSTLAPKPDGGNVVALYETHEDHPDGEAFVAGPSPVKVARTGQVHRLISDGVLEEVDEDEAAPPAVAPSSSTPSSQGTPPRTPLADDAPIDAAGVLTDAQRQALVAEGFVTVGDVRRVTDDLLDAVDGIGPGAIERLREATKE